MGKIPILKFLRIPTGREFLFGLVACVIGALVVAMVALRTGVGGFGMGDPSAANPTERSAQSSAPDAATLASLQSAFDAEVKARTEIATRLAELEAKITILESAFDASGEQPLSENDSIDVSGDSKSDESADEAAGENALVEASQFDDEVLLSIGIDRRDVERLRDRWVSHHLDIAAISHEAVQGGWFQQQRHREELIGLEIALRREIEDAEYDRYLYASGKPNRLRAAEVLPGSSASDAGLRPGDVILSYDGARIFGTGDLLNASSRVESARSVHVQILREDRLHSIYIEPGPLGVLLKPSWAPPQ